MNNMTLKEKLFNVIFDNAFEFKTKNVVPECEEIADYYAIDFAEWYLNLWHTDDDSSFDNNSPQELLEIYKKEKGL